MSAWVRLQEPALDLDVVLHVEEGGGVVRVEGVGRVEVVPDGVACNAQMQCTLVVPDGVAFNAQTQVR